jgi:hypothetical protein
MGKTERRGGIRMGGYKEGRKKGKQKVARGVVRECRIDGERTF